jgi:ABC-type polysaccharide/polyol phosphate transport system ATPase subunit
MRIIQISDICFPEPDKTGAIARRAEYELMCNTLRQSFVAHQVCDKDIIMITGGLVHYNVISREGIKLFNMYMEMFTEFAHVYVIPGETDCIMRHAAPRESVLEDLVKPFKRATFIGKTHAYKIRDTVFMIKSCLDDEPISEAAHPSDILVTRNQNMLGNYTRRILAGERDHRTMPHIVCGALFQNSAQETHDKSYIIYEDAEVRIVPVSNPYGYVSVCMTNNVLDDFSITHPYEIKLFARQCTAEAVTKCVMDLQHKYQITVNVSYELAAPGMMGLPEHEVLEKMPEMYRQQFVSDWQKHTTPAGPRVNLSWRIDELKLEQFVVYENTSIKFERGCTAIIAANGSGKSLLLDACMMALYKRPIRGLPADYKDAHVSAELQNQPPDLSPYSVTRMMNFLATNDEFAKTLSKDDINTIQKIKGMDQLAAMASAITVACNAATNAAKVPVQRPACVSIHDSDIGVKLATMRARLQSITPQQSTDELARIATAQAFLSAHRHLVKVPMAMQAVPEETIAYYQASRAAHLRCAQMTFNSSCHNCTQNMSHIGIAPGLGLKEIDAYIANSLAINAQLKYNEYYDLLDSYSKRPTLSAEHSMLQQDIEACEAYEKQCADYTERARVRDFYTGYAAAFNEASRRIFAYRTKDFETEVNNVLARFTDFKFSISEDCSMHIIHRTVIPINVISSSQKFLLALAIKCALNRTCVIPRLNMLFIDEGFAFLDDVHMRKIPQIMDYLKSQFHTVVIISHLAEVQNNCDHYYYIANGRITQDPAQMNIIQINPIVTVSQAASAPERVLTCETCGGKFKSFAQHSRNKGHIERAQSFLAVHGRPPGPRDYH